MLTERRRCSRSDSGSSCSGSQDIELRKACTQKARPRDLRMPSLGKLALRKLILGKPYLGKLVLEKLVLGKTCTREACPREIVLGKACTWEACPRESVLGKACTREACPRESVLERAVDGLHCLYMGCGARATAAVLRRHCLCSGTRCMRTVLEQW